VPESKRHATRRAKVKRHQDEDRKAGRPLRHVYKRPSQKLRVLTMEEAVKMGLIQKSDDIAEKKRSRMRRLIDAIQPGR
jgi:hypothetical protein